MERLWDFMFSYELQAYPETGSLTGTSVLLTEPPAQDTKAREQTAQIFFETFKTPGLCMCNSAVLSLFASGRTRGLVVECGSGVTSTVPVFEGFALPHGTLRVNLGGQDVTKWLHDKIQANGYRNVDFDTARIIKEKLSCIAPTETPTDGPPEPGHYELPDGVCIELDPPSRTACASSVLFPQLSQDKLDTNLPADPTNGVSALVHKSITMCDRDLQPDLYGSIVIAGGASMTPGFAERIKNDVARVTPSSMPFKVVPDPNTLERGYNSQRKIAAWIGGSMFGSMNTFKNVLITKQEWEDAGESIIHRKCI